MSWVDAGVLTGAVAAVVLSLAAAIRRHCRRDNACGGSCRPGCPGIGRCYQAYDDEIDTEEE